LFDPIEGEQETGVSGLKALRSLGRKAKLLEYWWCGSHQMGEKEGESKLISYITFTENTRGKKE